MMETSPWKFCYLAWFAIFFLYVLKYVITGEVRLNLRFWYYLLLKYLVPKFCLIFDVQKSYQNKWKQRSSSKYFARFFNGRHAEMWIRILTVRVSNCYGSNDKISIPKVKIVLGETYLEYLVQFRGEFRTQWNIYDGAFLQSTFNRWLFLEKNSIVDGRLDSKVASGVLFGVCVISCRTIFQNMFQCSNTFWFQSFDFKGLFHLKSLKNGCRLNSCFYWVILFLSNFCGLKLKKQGKDECMTFKF